MQIGTLACVINLLSLGLTTSLLRPISPLLSRASRAHQHILTHMMNSDTAPRGTKDVDANKKGQRSRSRISRN